MNKRKWIVSIICMCLLLGGSLPVYGSDQTDTGENADCVSVSSVTDPDELQQIIENEDLSVPEGYHLE